MCLFNNIKCIAKFLQNQSPVKEIKVYKVLSNGKSFLKAIHFKKLYNVGWNKSDRRNPKLILSNISIYKGIHVYLSKSQAMKKKNGLRSHATSTKVVEFTAHIQDLIGVSHNNQAVFSKVYLSKAEYEKHTNKKK